MSPSLPSDDNPHALSTQRPQTQAIFQVGELVSTLKQGLEMNFPALWVEGEVSNFMAARSGHWYFTLKDQQAQIRCAFFRGQNRRAEQPANGARCLVHGRATVFVARGELQLVVDALEDAGAGALHLAFERLKRTLDAEGLFAPERKRPIPAAPRCIGVLTSAVGAALHDVCSTLERRNPLVKVIVYPIPVQGAGAAARIVSTLRTAIDHQECDVLLLTRGGGSAEDLQAFNDEALARAVAACPIPTVSAIGHEVDFSICDFVADARAATPTAAAELLSPDRAQWRSQITQARARLRQSLAERLRTRRQLLDSLTARLTAASPQRRLFDRAQLLDELQRRLLRSTRQRIDFNRVDHQRLHRALSRAPLQQRIIQARHRQQALHTRLLQLQSTHLRELAMRLEHLRQRLYDLAPEQVLSRGYGIIWHGETAVRSPGLPAGERLRIQVAHGIFSASVCEPD